MTDGGSGSGSISRFGAFVLDTGRALLTRDGAEVTLRPKTFALLTYMTRHPGRVLAKEELLAAVWPGVVVNDESLSQCVRELRAALGDERQALIRTIPRRGYLFEAPVPDAPAAVRPIRARRRAARTALAFAGVALLVGVALLLQRPRAPIDPPIDTRRSVAVLPFGEGGTGGSLLGEGVAEDLSYDLGRRPGMLVVSFVSSAAVAARESDMGRIGRALGARYLVTGSVRRDGAAVDVSAQLLSAHDAAVLWSGRYRYAAMADWAWQRDIGSAVARALDLPATTQDSAPSGAPNSLQMDAFDATLKGRQQLRNISNLADLRRARAHFERALSLEPDSALGWTRLARTDLGEVEYGWAGDRQALLARAEQALERALALSPGHPATMSMIGVARRERGDIEGALHAFQTALTSDPNLAWAHASSAAVKLRLGRPEEVLVHADMALRLSPFEPTLVGYSHLWAGIAEFYLGREDAAYERMRQSVNAGPNPTRYGALLWLASLDALHGRESQAAQHTALVMQLDAGFTITKWRTVTALMHPRLAAGRERFAEGMRRAGLPE